MAGSSLNFVFFGTSALATTVLEGLAEAGSIPRLVVTTPTEDKPVAAWADAQGIEILRPESLLDPAFLGALVALAPDAILLVDYPFLLPEEVLAVPKKGAAKIHASLLPKFRGRHPVRAAIAAGVKETGVTVMEMDENLDAGPILSQESLELGPREVYGELYPRIEETMVKSAVGICQKLAKSKGRLKGKKQVEKKASTSNLPATENKAAWSLNAKDFYNQLRAHLPDPGLLTYFRLKPVHLLSGTPIDWEQAPFGTTGTYLGLRQGRMAILCGEGTIFGVGRLRRADGQTERASDFVRREGLRVGQRFV